jgi:hypothetical protein
LKETNKAVSNVKKSIVEVNKGKDLILKRIKEQSWDNMLVKHRAVVALKADARVDNFVLRKRSAAEEAILAKVNFLRKIQILERQWSTPNSEGDTGII